MILAEWASNDDRLSAWERLEWISFAILIASIFIKGYSLPVINQFYESEER